MICNKCNHKLPNDSEFVNIVAIKLNKVLLYQQKLLKKSLQKRLKNL